MDSLGALALATEPPSQGEFKKEKAKKADKIINKVMWRNILG